MPKTPHTVPTFIVYLFMGIGLLSAIAFRLLTIINSLNPALMRPLWYFGVVGYILFFAYRYHITEKRRKTILENHLLDKIQSGETITRNDRDQIEYVLFSLVKSKENINYLFIFVLSILAVAVDIILA